MLGFGPMLSASCPNCGAIASLSLEHPEKMDCAYCGGVFPNSERLRGELVTAQAVLAGTDRSRRELEGLKGRALSASAPALLGPLILGVAIILSGVAFGLGWLIREFVGSPNQMLMGQVSAALMAVPAAAAILRLWWNHRRLRRACAAIPPPVEGAAARCFVCGASLPVSGEAVMRCDFCGAGNLRPAVALQKAHGETRHVTQDIAAEVKRHAEVASHGLGRGILVLVLGSLSMPLVGVGSIKAVEEWRWRRPPEVEIVVTRPTVGDSHQGVDSGLPLCLARVHHGFLGRRVRSFSPETPNGIRSLRRSDDDDYIFPNPEKVRAAEDLVGGHVWTHDGRVGVIRKVAGPSGDGQPVVATIDAPGGSLLQALGQSCFHQGASPELIADLGSSSRVSGGVALWRDGVVARADTRMVAWNPTFGVRTYLLEMPDGGERTRGWEVAGDFAYTHDNRRLLRVSLLNLPSGGRSVDDAVLVRPATIANDLPTSRFFSITTISRGSWLYWSQVSRNGSKSRSGILRAGPGAGDTAQHIVDVRDIQAFGATDTHVYYTSAGALYRAEARPGASPGLLGRHHLLLKSHGRLVQVGGILTVPLQDGFFGVWDLQTSTLRLLGQRWVFPKVVGSKVFWYRTSWRSTQVVPGLLVSDISSGETRYLLPGVYAPHRYAVGAHSIFSLGIEMVGTVQRWDPLSDDQPRRYRLMRLELPSTL